MSIKWTPIRLIMEEEEREIGQNDRTAMNGSVSAVTVRETRTEGLVRHRAKFLSEISKREENTRSESMGDYAQRRLIRPISLGFDDHSRTSTVTTKAVLETPPNSCEGTMERTRPLRYSLKTADVMCSTSDLSVPRISITPPDEKPCEKKYVEPQFAEPTTEPLIHEPKMAHPIGDGDGERNQEKAIQVPKSEAVPMPPTPVAKEEEKVDCMVDCLYFTMQCCECNIL